MRGESIREITMPELTGSVDVIRRSFLTVANEFGLTKENSPTNGAFLEYDKLLDDYKRGIKMFGLFADDKQAGFVALEKKDSDLFCLEKLAVLPEYRHRGYGGMLTGHVKKIAAVQGGKEISIGIIHDNKRLLNWYESQGFEVTEIKRFEHLPFTVCFMKLDI